MVGFDGVLDKESRLYIRLLVRLIDKSFDEYMMAREYITEETKTQDKLAYRFNIISHLENSINAINRAIKIFEILIYGKKVNNPCKKGKLQRERKNLNILNFISSETLGKIKKHSVSKIRNRIEHIDVDIFDNEFKGTLFLDTDDKYEEICINNKCLPLSNLTSIIEDSHNFVLEVFNNLPNRIEDGVYYYDKK